MNLVGQKFGRLTVIAVEKVKKTQLWLCECECGKKVNRTASQLRRWKSCGCLKDSFGTRDKKATGEAARNAIIYHQYKQKKKGFFLTNEDCERLFKSNCFYCGKEPTQVFAHEDLNGSYTYNGIDRQDNAKGYTIDNSVACCTECNRMKRTDTVEEFKEWIIKIYDNLSKKGV